MSVRGNREQNNWKIGNEELVFSKHSTMLINRESVGDARLRERELCTTDPPSPSQPLRDKVYCSLTRIPGATSGQSPTFKSRLWNEIAVTGVIIPVASDAPEM